MSDAVRFFDWIAPWRHFRTSAFVLGFLALASIVGGDFMPLLVGFWLYVFWWPGWVLLGIAGWCLETILNPPPGYTRHVHCGDAVWGGVCPDPSWHSPFDIRGHRYPDGSTDYSREHGVPRSRNRPVGMEPW